MRGVVAEGSRHTKAEHRHARTVSSGNREHKDFCEEVRSLAVPVALVDCVEPIVSIHAQGYATVIFDSFICPCTDCFQGCVEYVLAALEIGSGQVGSKVSTRPEYHVRSSGYVVARSAGRGRPKGNHGVVVVAVESTD